MKINYSVYQVDQLVFEELVRENFPKLGLHTSHNHQSSYIWFFTLHETVWYSSYYPSMLMAVNHLDYLGVQVAWFTGPWFLSIFVNMIPWESGEIYETLLCVV